MGETPGQDRIPAATIPPSSRTTRTKPPPNNEAARARVHIVGIARRDVYRGDHLRHGLRHHQPGGEEPRDAGGSAAAPAGSADYRAHDGAGLRATGATADTRPGGWNLSGR